MARPLRIEFSGAIYHITSRGNAQADIYITDQDRWMFLDLFGRVCEQFNWSCHAYCLMTNHYHVVIETGDGNLSKGMRHMNGVYTQAFNRQHRRVGHVFQGRYKAILVDKDNYLLEVIRYVLLNPVRAQMTKTAGQYPWSSYRGMIDKIEAPGWLSRDWVLGQFAKSKKQAQQKFIQFIRNGKDQPPLWENLRNQMYLGDERFVKKMHMHIQDDRSLAEVPRIQRRQAAKPIEYYAKNYPPKEAMRQAYALGEYTFKAIADYFGVHYSTVSRAVNSK